METAADESELDGRGGVRVRVRVGTTGVATIALTMSDTRQPRLVSAGATELTTVQLHGKRVVRHQKRQQRKEWSHQAGHGGEQDALMW